MAITILTTPQRLTPAYNPVEFTFSSNNSANTGFRYLVDVYSGNSNTLLTRQRIAPQLDNSGKCDISRILNNQLDYDANLSTTTAPNLTTKSKFDYSIRVGEEYFLPPLAFTNAAFLSAGTIIITGTTAHNYFVGDVLFITSNTNINGFYDIKTIPNPSAFTIAFFGGLATPNSGTTQLAGAAKRQFSGLTTSSGFTVFNGVKKFEDFITYSATNFILSGTSTTRQALTDQPASNFYVTTPQDLIMNFYVSGANNDTYFVRGVSDTAQSATTTSFTGNGTNQLIQFKVGFTNLGFTASTINYYDIALYKNANIQLTKTYRMTIDKRCTIEPLEILFMDRMGSMSSFAFQLRSQENGTINRTQYKQQVGRVYNVYDRGDTNININFDKEFTLNTNFMTEEMSIYFEQLLTSPYTWVKMNNQYLACMITDNSFEVVHQKNKRLINYTIKIKLANSNNINI